MKDFFKLIHDLYTKPHELAAIWLNKPVATSEGKTVRIAPEMLISVKENEIQEQGEFTHRVIGCYGTLINQFEISVIDITNNDLSILQL